MNTVEIDDVVHSYRRRRALLGASWKVGTGINALLGPNGSGKTTLLRCIVGELTPEGGSIRIAGEAVGTDAARALLGYVPQRPTMPGLATVRDLVAYAAWLSRVPSRDLDRAVDGALRDLDVSDLARRRIRTLSGGQRQRVALATAVVHRPRILVLDEPTVGLDPGQRLKVRQLIHRLGQQIPVIMSTHLTEDVEHLASTVAILVGGKIQFSGELEELQAAVGEVEPSLGQDGALLPTFGSPFEQSYEALMSHFGPQE